jgi:hypothetical protein
MQPVHLPIPLEPASARALRQLVLAHGARTTARAMGTTRHLLLVALAGLPLAHELRDRITARLDELSVAGRAQP